MIFLGGSPTLIWPWEGPIAPPGPSMVLTNRKDLNLIKKSNKAKKHPAASGNRQLRGRLDVRLFLSGRHPPGLDSIGCWRMGDDVWKGQTEGSVLWCYLATGRDCE